MECPREAANDFYTNRAALVAMELFISSNKSFRGDVVGEVCFSVSTSLKIT